MNHRQKPAGKFAGGKKAGDKACHGCCDRCHKISDGVYVTPFFLSKRAEEKGKGQ